MKKELITFALGLQRAVAGARDQPGIVSFNREASEIWRGRLWQGQGVRTRKERGRVLGTDHLP